MGERRDDRDENKGRRATPLPFDPVGKTHYTAEEARTPRVIRRFSTWAEFKAFVDEAAPTRADDTPVLPGTNGRRATPEELRVFIDEQERRQRGDG